MMGIFSNLKQNMGGLFAPGDGGSRFMDRMNTPQAQIAMRLLQASQGAPGKPAGSLGAIFGDSVMGYQNDAQQQQMQKLQMELLRSQTARMNKPDPVDRGRLVSVQGEKGPQYQYEADAVGMTPYQQPQGNGSDPSEVAIARYLNDPATPEAAKTELRSLLKSKYSTPQSEPLVSVQMPDGTQSLIPRSQAAGRQPGVAAPPKPIDAGMQAQNVGIQNLGIAVDEYTKALPSFSAMDFLNPTERARIGTVYNNMMLQAKEAYRLGVLNGPDFDILQKVVTDPMTIKGAVTSNTALAKQATELKRIMERMRGNVVGAKPTGNSGSALPDNDPLGILK
jgi:hypothetical protein